MSNTNTTNCEDGIKGCRQDYIWICQVVAAEGIFGVIGNILVCFVILRVKFLHCLTNYLLVNLAVADGLICLQTFVYNLSAAPYCELVSFTPRSELGREIFCRLLATNYLGWALSYTTSYSLCLVTLERYVAIVHPLQYARMLTAARMWGLIALIWVMSFPLALPFLFTNRSSDDPSRPCTGIQYPGKMFPVIVGLTSCLMVYFLPIVSMSLAYYKIQVTLKRQAKDLNLQYARQAAYSLVLARQRLVSMLTLVLGALVVLWTPQYVLALFCLHPVTGDDNTSLPVCSKPSYIHIRGVCRALFYMNSVINPIIYEFKYKKFRQGFKIAICCCFKKYSNNIDIELVENYNFEGHVK